MTYSFSNTPVYVSEGQTVRFKFKAPSQWNTTQSVTIQIGDQQTIWYITTIPEDFAPDPFPFTPLEDADSNVMYVYGDGTRPGEDIVTVSGLTPTTTASVTLTGSLAAQIDNFSVRIKRVSQGETEFGAWIIPSGEVAVENTDELQLRLRSNTAAGLNTFADLSIGARVERWTIGTEVPPPNIPEPFPDFDDITNVPLNKDVYSNILQVQGLSDTALITASNTDLYVGISSSNATFTTADGYEILQNTGGTSKYEQIGLESYVSTHFAPITFLQALDDTTGGGNQPTWLQDYVTAVQAVPGNATATLTTVATGGHNAFTTDATLQAAIRTAVGSTDPGVITTATFDLVPDDGETATIDGTSYPVAGSLYVPTGLADASVDVVVLFHGTLTEGGTSTIAQAASDMLTRFTDTSSTNINVRDKIIFSVAYPQDHISASRQYNLPDVGTENANFLMGDNLPYTRAAVEWVKNSLDAYITAQGGTKTVNDIYLFGHSQGGKLVSKINTLDDGIAGVIADSPGPIQLDQTCSIAANQAGTTCSKIAAIYGVPGSQAVPFYQVIGPNYPTINNGEYLQLRLRSENTAGAQTTTSLGIGDEPDGSNWSITTGNFPSTTPDSFVFQNVTDVLEDSLIGSDPRPLPNGITGLGTGTEVDVTLVSSTGTQPRIKIQYAEGGESSIGLFPTKVNNGDKIILYNKSSATFGGSVQMQIKVGDFIPDPWLIVTNTGPDTDADFVAPNNLVNQVPNTQVVSSIVSVSGINRPITISATNGALISIDFATPTSSTVTFDPAVNDSFRVFIQSATGLSGQVSTTVTVGTGSPNQFIWQVSNYAVAPPPPDLKGAWYSKKNALVDSNGDIIESKDDGHSIGTVVPVLKRPDGTYGTLDGELNSRFPGYLECDGELYDAADYPDLYEVIEETYGGTGVSYDASTKVYTGQFRVPDLRNRKLVGTGVVDGNRASSAFPPVDAGGSIYEPGGIGGWWYVDDVDVAGDNPYEQILGEAGGTTGVTSNFFSLGTVKTVFDADLVADVDFSITGSVTALIGPLLDTLVSVPPHTHLYVTGLVDGVSGDPLIEWTDRGMAALPGDARLDADGSAGLGAAQLNPFGAYDDGVAKDDTQTIVDLWMAALATHAPNFQLEWDEIDGVDDLETIVFQMIGDIQTKAYNGSLNGAAGPANSGGDANMRVMQTLVAETWWPSPYSVVSDNYFFQVSTVNNSSTGFYGVDGGSGARQVTGVIDTNQRFVRVDSYTPPILDGDSGATESHAHLITLQPVTDLTEDYSYGNVSGWGSGREGLGAAQTTLNVTFTQAEVGMELNVGTFTLNTSIKKPIPNVAFSPNRKVELLPEFHKVKYIIKAY